MNNEQRNEFMPAMRWKTFGYAVAAVGGLLISSTITVTLGVAAIRGDISRMGLTEERHYLSTNHKIDSLQHDNKIEFRNIWTALKNIDSSRNGESVRTIYVKSKPAKMGLYTQVIDPITGAVKWKKYRP